MIFACRTKTRPCRFPLRPYRQTQSFLPSSAGVPARSFAGSTVPDCGKQSLPDVSSNVTPDGLMRIPIYRALGRVTVRLTKGCQFPARLTNNADAVAQPKTWVNSSCLSCLLTTNSLYCRIFLRVSKIYDGRTVIKSSIVVAFLS